MRGVERSERDAQRTVEKQSMNSYRLRHAIDHETLGSESVDSTVPKVRFYVKSHLLD
jgi:hypothetical protein